MVGWEKRLLLGVPIFQGKNGGLEQRNFQYFAPIHYYLLSFLDRALGTEANVQVHLRFFYLRKAGKVF
jgi:hypothetical protein